MNILFSGGSSFTGYWFVKELRSRGHDVLCTFRGSSLEGYSELRGWRASELCQQGPAAFDCTVEEMIDRATHTILIGRVRAIRCTDGAGALIYAHGRFQELPDS